MNENKNLRRKKERKTFDGEDRKEARKKEKRQKKSYNTIFSWKNPHYQKKCE